MKKIYWLFVGGICVLTFFLGWKGVKLHSAENDVVSTWNEEDSEPLNRKIIEIWDYSKDSDSAGGIEAYVKAFNEQSDTYFVEYVYGYEEGVSLEEYRKQVSEALKHGQGAAILNMDVLDNPEVWMADGAFEDLCVCMEQAGLTPAVFAGEIYEDCMHGGKLYGMKVRVDMWQYSTLFLNRNASGKEGALVFMSYLMEQVSVKQ